MESPNRFVLSLVRICRIKPENIFPTTEVLPAHNFTWKSIRCICSDFFYLIPFDMQTWGTTCPSEVKVSLGWKSWKLHITPTEGKSSKPKVVYQQWTHTTPPAGSDWKVERCQFGGADFAEPEELISRFQLYLLLRREFTSLAWVVVDSGRKKKRILLQKVEVLVNILIWCSLQGRRSI